MVSTIASDQPIGSNMDRSLQQTRDKQDPSTAPSILIGRPIKTGISASNFNSL